MATVRKRKDAGAGRKPWLVAWVDPTGKERKRSFNLAREAHDYRKKIEQDLAKGTYIEPSNTRTTVNEVADRWWPTTARLARGTRTRYESALRVHVRQEWGDKVVSSIKKTDVSIWTANMTDGGSGAGTVRQAYRVLSLILKFAVDDGVILANPAVGADKPRAVRDVPVFLSPVEVFRLATQCADGGTVIYVLAYTGMRFGELAHLRVGDVDLRRCRLNVRASSSEVGGVFDDNPTTKTHQSRQVPFPPFITERLKPLIQGRDSDERLFIAPLGGPLRENNWRRRAFDPAIGKRRGCELTCAAEKRTFLGPMIQLGFPGLTPHNLRDTAASLAVQSGASVKAVQRMLGHASAAMTLDVYAGLWDDDLDDVARRMEERRPVARAGNL